MTDENKEGTAAAGADATEASTGTENTGTTPGGEATPGEASTALSGADAGTQADEKDTKGADATAATESKEEWREKIIKHDPTATERLKRFPSQEAMWDSYRELEKKLSSGAHKKELGADATPEQLAAWRKDNDIPEKFEDYDLKFESGLVISDTDKPKVDKILQVMHSKNVPTGTAKEVIATYFKEQQEDVKKLTEYQEQTTNECVLDLKKEWGADKFDRNIKMIKELYIGDDNLFNKINSAILPDGKSLASDKDMIRFLAAKAFHENPYASVSNGSGMATGHSIEAEKIEIEALMGDRNSKYWKGSESAKLQDRYLELTRASLATQK